MLRFLVSSLLMLCLQVSADPVSNAAGGNSPQAGVSSSQTSHVETTLMPAPQITQFSAQAGAAPVATAKADNVVQGAEVVDSSKNNVSPKVDNAESGLGSSHHGMPATVQASADLTVLRTQVQNLFNQNDSGKITALQEQIEKMNGILAEEKNSLATLEKKQNQFYQDLDQRISMIEQIRGKSAQVSSSAVSGAADAAASQASSPGTQDITVYQQAFSLVSANRYNQAQVALQGYMKNYPKGKYINEARYWSGEIYFLRKQYQQAEKQFFSVIKDGTDKRRLPIAQLRLARIYLSTNRLAQAKKLLQKIQKQYPGTTSSKMASIYLKEV
jgi:tol-pal system protein YbgF